MSRAIFGPVFPASIVTVVVAFCAAAGTATDVRAATTPASSLERMMVSFASMSVGGFGRGRQAIDHHVPIGLAGVDARRGEARLVRGIGKLLRFERDAVAHAVHPPAAPGRGAIEEVASVELEIGRAPR